MILRRVWAAMFAAVSMITSAWAVSPAQVGTYTGTVKTVTTVAGNRTVTKEPIRIEIAADESTTVTINNIDQVVEVSMYNGKDVAIIYVMESGGTVTQTLASLSFKGTTLKGTSTGLRAMTMPTVSLQAALAAKYKLKKQIE
jgi:hypothetical protein